MPHPMLAADCQLAGGLWGEPHAATQHSTQRNARAPLRPTHGAPHTTPASRPGAGAGAGAIRPHHSRACAANRAIAASHNPLATPLTPHHNAQHQHPQSPPLLPPTPSGHAAFLIPQGHAACAPRRRPRNARNARPLVPAAAGGEGASSSPSSSSSAPPENSEASAPLPAASSGAPLRLPSVYQCLKAAAAVALGWLALQALGGLLADALLTAAPPLLTYATMALVYWPWPLAVLLGVLTLVLAARDGAARRREGASSAGASSAGADAADQAVAGGRGAALGRQVVILAGALTWLILVPCGHFQGFLGAWPLVLFCAYALFFAESAFIRCWLYGDLASRAQDKQWSTPTTKLAQVGFVAALVGTHWAAAWESPLLALALSGAAPRPSPNWPALALLFFALWLHWDATLVLGKYFDRLVPPQVVVTTGPYRWVRHPIYTSYMLLFAGYCAGLRSYKSLFFVVATCLWYYNLRTRLEEEQLAEHFGEVYEAYQKRVDKRFLPYLF